MDPVGNQNVSVVILTKNAARTLEQCLRSIVDQKPAEIIAVDGFSTDGTIDILNRHVVRIISDRERSLARARQLGVEAAKETYVMFVDSDVVLASRCISKLKRDLEDHGWVGVHARLLSAENLSYWQKAEDKKFRRYTCAGPTSQIDTIAALFRRETLLEYPFDPRFKESNEDVDLSRRLVKGNFRLGISEAVAYHYHRREFSAFVRQRFRGGIGNGRMALKYASNRVFVDYNPLLTALSEIIRTPATNGYSMIPYWIAGGTAGFLGTLAGFSRARRPANNPKTRLDTN